MIGYMKNLSIDISTVSDNRLGFDFCWSRTF